MNIRNMSVLILSVFIVFSPIRDEPAEVTYNIYLPFVKRMYSAMVFVPAGKFRMGCQPSHNGGHPCSSYEVPLHIVNLDSYYIDKYEVTNLKYSECVAAGDCTAPIKFSSHTRPAYYDNPVYAQFPVMFVSKANAQDFADGKANAFQPKPSGRKLLVERPPERTLGGIRVLIVRLQTHITNLLLPFAWEIPPGWAATPPVPVPMARWIWRAMSGSGLTTGGRMTITASLPS